MMKFVLKPSLEHMALVKIVVTLWNKNDIRALMANLGPPQYFLFCCINDELNNEDWGKIEDRVKVKVPQLSLPQILKEKVLGLIKPIGLQISEWMHSHLLHLRIDLPVKFCWTPQGTINREKTAEVLIKDENLDLSTRYKLACMYCFEKDIIHFWNTMPENIKRSVLDSAFPHIVDVWSCDMQRRGRGNAHSNIHKFEYCASSGFKAATEYYLNKLTPMERQKSLVNTAKYVDDADVLYFLLSKMNEEQQIEVFKDDPFPVLQSFLQWPFQIFFIEIANRIWDFLRKEQFGDLLRAIIDKATLRYKDWNYQKLFREFWQKSPNALKCFITNDLNDEQLLMFLFDIKDKENIRLIFKSITVTVKKKLIYSDKMNSFFQRSIRDNEWDILELFIRECLPSKNEMLKFKDEFEKRIMWDNVEDNLARNKQKWNQLFHLSDDSIFNCNKRHVEEGESSSSKRFQSLQ